MYRHMHKHLSTASFSTPLDQHTLKWSLVGYSSVKESTSPSASSIKTRAKSSWRRGEKKRVLFFFNDDYWNYVDKQFDQPVSCYIMLYHLVSYYIMLYHIISYNSWFLKKGIPELIIHCYEKDPSANWWKNQLVPWYWLRIQDSQRIYGWSNFPSSPMNQKGCLDIIFNNHP